MTASGTTLVHLVRHGESAGNVDPSLPRGFDPPLTALGETQARRAASALAPLGLEALFSSPLRRARETAAAIGAVAGLPVVVVEGFGEVDMGDLADPPDPRARVERDQLFAAWLAGDRSRAFPGGEDFASVCRRVELGLRFVSADHRVVAVVTHRIAIAAAGSLCAAERGPVPSGPCANGSITTLRGAEGRWSLVTWGDARHSA